MKFGLIPVNVGGPDAGENMVRLGQESEAVGMESLWTFEHVIIPLDYQSRYPYHHSGKLKADPDTNFIDPLIALSYLAAKTERLRLGTGVNIAPQSNPLTLAKQAASLDYLSGGRLMLGLGAGWLEEEFRAMGAPFERRGARFDDYLVAMKKVWAGEVVEHRSEFLDWSGFKSYPLPVQKPHVPLIIGGTTPAAVRRVAAHGDGWITVGTPEELASSHALLKEECAKLGRDPDSIEITATWIYVKEGANAIKAYEDMGVSRLLTHGAALGPGDPFTNLERFGDEVIAKF